MPERWLRVWCAASMLAALSAQEPTADVRNAVAPELRVQRWLVGPPVVARGEGAAKVVLVLDLGAGVRFAKVAAPFADLQRRFEEAGLRVVVTVPVEPKERFDPKTTFAVGVGIPDDLVKGGELFPEAEAYLIVDGELFWNGHLANGPGVLAAQLLAGKVDRAALWQLMIQQQALQKEDEFPFGDDERKKVLADTAAVLASNPGDGIAWAMRYCALAQDPEDTERAAAVLKDALAALTADPFALAAFADLTLRSLPWQHGLAERLWPLLTQACPLAPDDPMLQLTALRALVRAGKAREVGRRAQLLRKQCDGDAGALLVLGEVLASDVDAAVHKDVIGPCLRRIDELGVDPDGGYGLWVQGLRYAWLRTCEPDAAAAAKLLDSEAEQAGANIGLNNRAWYTMTMSSTRGRFPALTTALCDKLLEDRASLDGFVLDTCALGMLLGGRLPEAIELQQAAIAKTPGRAVYQARLRLFEAVQGKK